MKNKPKGTATDLDMSTTPYFIDEDHIDNFYQVTQRWDYYCNRGNEEYLSACYILAIPMIFDKVKNIWQDFDSPTTWAWLHGEGKLDLSGGMARLGELTRHLFNSNYTNFNLVDCMTSLDEEHYKAMMTAIHTRRVGMKIVRD